MLETKVDYCWAPPDDQLQSEVQTPSYYCSNWKWEWDFVPKKEKKMEMDPTFLTLQTFSSLSFKYFL